MNEDNAARLYAILLELYNTAHHTTKTDTRRRLAQEGMRLLPIPLKKHGELAEWFMAPVLKTDDSEMGP